MARREEEAEAMIVNLSTFFRQSLTLDPTDDVPLRQEIDFQKLYLDIEKVRFPSRLNAVFDVPHALGSARVPPLILQPIIENAIKHGVARTAQPVTLTVSAREADDRLVITVDNDGGGEEVRDTHGTGVGLVNVCERLEARFGGEAECEHARMAGGGYRVTLSMPLEEE
jgi:LytS/YehU family sensor histidine kinase